MLKPDVEVRTCWIPSGSQTMADLCLFFSKMSLGSDSCLPVTPPPPGVLSSGGDSSEELLSALSPEERELLGVITARGYPLCTAIIALQKTGQQTPDQVSRWLT